MGAINREKLTAAAVAALPVDGMDRLMFDPGTEGFGVRVTPSGTKLFIAQARVGGRPRRVTVGRFPRISLSQTPVRRLEMRWRLSGRAWTLRPRRKPERKRWPPAGLLWLNSQPNGWRATSPKSSSPDGR